MKLYVVRHGDTFNKGDVILRCGRRTDLPLSATGRDRADRLGAYFRAQNINPKHIYASPLRRTQETKSHTLGDDVPFTIAEPLNEIDHGPDEGKPEDAVIARLGHDVLDLWNKELVMPPEWSPRPEVIADNARAFLDKVAACPDDGDHMAFTSSGVARFFTLACTWDIPKPDDLKLSVCGFAVLEYSPTGWHVTAWNVKP